MTLETRIQTATKEYREDDVAGMSDEDVRTAAADAGIDGAETTPIVTLREELVQHYRNDLRAANYPKPQLNDDQTPGEGNPGSDYVDLT